MRGALPMVFLVVIELSAPRFQAVPGASPRPTAQDRPLTVADCEGLETRLDQFICREPESRQLASRLDRAVTTALARDPARAPAILADQTAWRTELPVSCIRMDPKADNGMELSECLRLVLTHRIEVLESGYLYRGGDRLNQVQSLPDPLETLPTSHRRKYVFHRTSETVQYFFSLVGDFYLSNSELVVSRLKGVFRLAYAGTMPDLGDWYMGGGRVYRVLNAREVRAVNRRGQKIDERLQQGLCSTPEHELRWIIVRAEVDAADRTGIWLSTAYIHDYADLMTRAYGSCGSFYLHLGS